MFHRAEGPLTMQRYYALKRGPARLHVQENFQLPRAFGSLVNKTD